MNKVEYKEQLKGLSLINRIKHWLSRRVWIPLGPDSPYGRLVIVRYSNKSYQVKRLDSLYNAVNKVKITHWMDLPNL